MEQKTEGEECHVESNDCSSIDNILVIADKFSPLDAKKRKHVADYANEASSDPAASKDRSITEPVTAAWLKPFDLGWKRELVYRSIGSECSTKTPPAADVYYFSPEGTKLRSMPQVIDHLEKLTNSDLTVACFTFTKRAIFHEPEERIRHAASARCRQSLAKSTLKTVSVEDSNDELLPADDSDAHPSKKLKPLRIVLSPTKIYSVDNTERSADIGTELQTTHSEQTEENIDIEGTCVSGVSQSDLSSINKLPTVAKDILTSSNADPGVDAAHIATDAGDENRPPRLSLEKEQAMNLCTMSPALLDSQRFNSEKSRDHTTSMSLTDMFGEHDENVCGPGLQKTTSAADLSQLACSVVPVSSNAPDWLGNNDEVNSNSANNTTSEHAMDLKFPTNGSHLHDSIQSLNQYVFNGSNGEVANGKPFVQSDNDVLKSVVDSNPAALFPGTFSEQNQNWIGAQILALPRDVANSLNLSRPITVRFNNRSIIVPSSCVALTAEGAKVLLPPHTLSPPSRTQLSEPMDFSVHSNSDLIDYRQTSGDRVPVEDKSKELSKTYTEKLIEIPVEKRTDNGESDGHVTSEVGQTAVKESVKELQLYERSRIGIEILDSNLDCMLHVLGYLSIMDIIRLSAVCERWRDISQHKSLICELRLLATQQLTDSFAFAYHLRILDYLRFILRCFSAGYFETNKWKSVCLKGLRVTDWPKAVATLARGCTRNLDLSGVLHRGPASESWDSFKNVADQLTSVTRLAFHDVTPRALYAVVEKMPQLESLCAASIFDTNPDPEVKEFDVRLDIGKFARLKNLRTLRLRGEETPLFLPSFSFNADIMNLGNLCHLQDLQLATLAVYGECFHFLSRLPQLEYLDIGDCLAWNKETYDVLGKLVNLRSLRLRYGGAEDDEGLPVALSNMKKLKSLELTRFNISTELACTLADLKQLETLIVHPSLDHEPWQWQNNSRTFIAACHMDFLKRLDWIVEGMDKGVGIVFGLPSLGGKVLSCRDELKTLVPGHDVEFRNLDHFQTYLRSILRFGTEVNVYPSLNEQR